jgi:glyoxylase-like metal-dependent hydrolase (beta-lactamase superfamily II)
MISWAKKRFKTFAEFAAQRKTTRQNQHYWVEIDNRQRRTFKNFVTMAPAICKSFCGGIFETNCYLFEAPDGWILFDAPDGACQWLRSLDIHPKLLLLTHGHVDHVQDVARIKQQFHCQIGCHPLTAPMISDRDFFRNFGFALEIEPVEPDFLIEETPNRSFLGADFRVLEVPGHCPGSLCFFSRKDRLLIGGDVLFAGSIGRGDLPGGNIDLLIGGIRRKLLPLGDDVTVLSGHGPPTTIGDERLTNPFLQA